jgi:hypothetical protein
MLAHNGVLFRQPLWPGPELDLASKHDLSGFLAIECKDGGLDAFEARQQAGDVEAEGRSRGPSPSASCRPRSSRCRSRAPADTRSAQGGPASGRCDGAPARTGCAGRRSRRAPGRRPACSGADERRPAARAVADPAAPSDLPPWPRRPAPPPSPAPRRRSAAEGPGPVGGGSRTRSYTRRRQTSNHDDSLKEEHE